MKTLSHHLGPFCGYWYYLHPLSQLWTSVFSPCCLWLSDTVDRRHWIPEAPAGGVGAVGVFSIRGPLRNKLEFSKGKPRVAFMSLDTQKTSQQADLGSEGRQVKPPSNFSFPSKIRNIRKQFTKHYKWASKHTWSTKALGVITMCGFFVPPQASTLSQPAKATYSFLILSRHTPGSSWWPGSPQRQWSLATSR